MLREVLGRINKWVLNEKNLRNNIYAYSFVFAMTLIQNKIMRLSVHFHPSVVVFPLDLEAL